MIQNKDVRAQQAAALDLQRNGMSREDIAKKLGISFDAVKRRLSSAKKAERLDPEIYRRLQAQGITDLAGLHSGWLLNKDSSGSGSSLYFYLGPDQEKISFVDALMGVLEDIPRLVPIEQMRPGLVDQYDRRNNYATWIALADLHVGSNYGDAKLAEDFNQAIDDLVLRLPPAKHAVLIELGDLLDANDHKGVTPHSGNPLDVRRDDHLANTMSAISLVRRALCRLLETHDTVEAHFIKGNHDVTAYMAVMLALSAHFADNPRITIHVSDAEYRVITWGQCAAFPHHGDTIKWPDLKDVFADQFADEWSAAKAHRLIMTAHFHHDRRRDLVGCTAEHYRTLHRPNNWAKGKGLFSRGSLTAMTIHKEHGEAYRTMSNIKNTLRGE